MFRPITSPDLYATPALLMAWLVSAERRGRCNPSCAITALLQERASTKGQFHQDPSDSRLQHTGHFQLADPKQNKTTTIQASEAHPGCTHRSARTSGPKVDQFNPRRLCLPPHRAHRSLTFSRIVQRKLTQIQHNNRSDRRAR